MSKKRSSKKDSIDNQGLTDKESILLDCTRHYDTWTEDNNQRRTRKNGWNDVTDAYWGKLPADWPYTARVVDPRIRTSIIEKTSRLLNAKLRGRLVPREGGDVLKARINNAILDFQWDSANNGGTMLEKWGMMDQDTRMYASKFGLVKWRHEVDDDGKVLFDGNEFEALDIRDCGMDQASNHVRDAKWFQHRKWEFVEDLEKINDTSSEDPMFPGLEELKIKMANRSDKRDTAYENRILSLKGLTDRLGDDKAFPIVELVTEYREDRWITFAPQYKVIIRDIENPYIHNKIPIVQLRYYSIQGDPIGESEVEPVLPLWRAIQATLCGFIDNMNLRMKPPLKIIDGQVRIETIVYGAEAQWVMDRVDSVTEMQSNGDAMRYFDTSYQALIASYNTAMGDVSAGNSMVNPMDRGKTATEIDHSAQQQNMRDQKNQTSLAESIEDMMSMWLSNNQQFLFADPDKQEVVLRIVGDQLFSYFKRAGLDQSELPPESMSAISDIISQQGGNMSDDDLNQIIEAGKVPKFPVFDNPNEKDPSKLQVKPKMTINDMGDGAEVSVVPEDVEGMYDYVADVKSMSSGADKKQANARDQAFQDTINPAVQQMLAQEGVKIKIKELLVSRYEDAGLKDAEQFFETVPQQPQQGQPQDPNQPNPMDPNAMGQAMPSPQQMTGQQPLPDPQMPQQGVQ